MKRRTTGLAESSGTGMISRGESISRCYDRSAVPTHPMSSRALTAFVIVLLFSAAPASGGQWSAAVTAARRGLPGVRVDLGYDGPYAPVENTPITLTATAGDVSFDGYIGYHFEVGGSRTIDTPVVARAVLRKHQKWSFSTFAKRDTRLGEITSPRDREVVIEWRDSSMTELALARAGAPPWSVQRQPLRIARTGEALRPLYDGQEAVVSVIESLSDRAQWYQGFGAVVVPVDVWLDVPVRVREAIVSSGISTIFFGLPRRGQTLAGIDRLSIPVVFEDAPGSVRVPWPYSESGAALVPSPMSWRSKAGSFLEGSPYCPYIAISVADAPWPVSENYQTAYVAEERALQWPLPSMRLLPLVRAGSEAFKPRGPTVREIVRAFFPHLAALLAALVSIAAWLALRKSPRPAVVMIVCALSAVVLFARDGIRPERGRYQVDRIVSSGPGLSWHMQSDREWGATPLPERTIPSERSRLIVPGRGWDRSRAAAEIRTSETPPGHGVEWMSSGWVSVERSEWRLQTGREPSIRIVSRDASKIVIDYDGSEPFDYALAQWAFRGTLYQGESELRGRKSGRVTIFDGRFGWPGRGDVYGFFSGYGATRVSLDRQSRGRTRAFEWTEPENGQSQTRGIRVVASTRPRGGEYSWAFALPVAGLTATATAVIKVPKSLARPEIRLTGPGGSQEIPRPSGQYPWHVSYLIPRDVLREVAAGGGIVHVALTPEDPDRSDPERVGIELSENRQ